MSHIEPFNHANDFTEFFFNFGVWNKLSNEKQLARLMNCFSFFKHKNYTLAKNKCQNNCFHKKLLIYSQLELKLNNFSSLQEVITQNMSIFRQIKY